MGKLYRSDNKVLAGVCAGVAAWAGLDAKLLRLIWVAAALLGGFSVVLYLVLWLVMPAKPASRSYSERMNEKLGHK